MKLDKLISGGQTGADRGGLDAAIQLEIIHGGWCPKNRKAEDGSIPTKYNLIETYHSGYKKRTELNVKDSNATLIFSIFPLSSGSRLTEEYCKQYGKPYLIVWFNHKTAQKDDIISSIIAWLLEEKPKVLNISGNRESINPGIQKWVQEILIEVIHGLSLFEED